MIVAKESVAPIRCKKPLDDYGETMTQIFSIKSAAMLCVATLAMCFAGQDANAQCRGGGGFGGFSPGYGGSGISIGFSNVNRGFGYGNIGGFGNGFYNPGFASPIYRSTSFYRGGGYGGGFYGGGGYYGRPASGISINFSSRSRPGYGYGHSHGYRGGRW